MRSRGNVLVLNQNVSGMNRFLFRELAGEWALNVKDVPYPPLARYSQAVLTFHPELKKWKKQHGEAMIRYHISAPCFRSRSRMAKALVEEHAAEAQIVFQISGTFNGLKAVRGRKRTMFASFNTHLAYTEWRPWAPFRTEKGFRAWYELEKELYHGADKILCTNRYVMRSFVRDYGIPEDRLHYIGYGVNFESLPEGERKYGSQVALFVGYDFQRKGGPTVVEAFRKARQKCPSARLRIIGPSTLDENYLGEGIEYLGRIHDRSVVQAHFREADFFVMPSVCEPFGLVFLEAMALGNSCIGSFRNAMPEIIEDGRSGFLVEVGDSDTLAGYMERLFSERELAARMGSAAVQRVNQEYTWPLCGERVKGLFRALLGS